MDPFDPVCPTSFSLKGSVQAFRLLTSGMYLMMLLSSVLQTQMLLMRLKGRRSHMGGGRLTLAQPRGQELPELMPITGVT